MEDKVQCPRCKNDLTQPYVRGVWDSGSQGMDKLYKQLGVRKGDTFADPENLRRFRAGEMRAVCSACGLIFDVNTPSASKDD